MPIYILNPIKANMKGVTLFGFWQNLANIRSEEGFIPYRVLYRMSSIFDKPVLFIQYFICLFRKVGDLDIKYFSGDSIENYSHEVSDIRNIYRFRPDLIKGNIVVYNNTVINGHHRAKAGDEVC